MCMSELPATQIASHRRCRSSNLPGLRSSTSPFRYGFTLVELIIATVVLAVGLLALTSAGAAIVKLERRGDRFSHVATVGATRLELLRAQGCSATSGVAGGGRLAERWTVVKLSARTYELVDSIMPSVSGDGAASRDHAFRSASRC